MATWQGANTVSAVSRDENGIKSTVYAPGVYSEPNDTMFYKMYLYVLKNTEQAAGNYSWGENFNGFVSKFKGQFIEPMLS